MSEHRDDPIQPDEDSLLRRWYAASSLAEPIPPAELLALGERAHRARRTRRSLAVATVTLVAVVVGIAGVGAWANFRAAPGPAGPTTPTSSATLSQTPSPSPSPSPSAQGSGGPALAEHESIVQVHRTKGGGWLLTDSRLIVTDGSSWRDCWTSNGDAIAPGPYALVAGRTVRVFAGLTMWTSTDGCASWAQGAVPVTATGAAFPTESIGYVSYVDPNVTNQVAQIYRTDDAGLHWAATSGKVKAPSKYGFSVPLRLAFADPDHGWLTDGHALWSTANGGRSWTSTVLPVPASVRDQLDVITTPVVGADGSAVVTAKYDATPGLDGARGQRVIYRTVDGGAHWTASAVLDDPGTLMISLDDPTAWVALDPSDPATVRTSVDGGATWQTTAVRERWPFTAGWFTSDSISFADSSHGWMAVQEPPPPCPGAPAMICDYAFSPPQHLVATDDGGATWHQLDP